MKGNWISWISSLPARIGLGVVAMGSIAGSLPVAPSAHFDGYKAAGVGTAIATWLWAEISSHTRSPHPHDVQLFRNASALIDPGLEWFRSHDFGNSFQMQHANGLHLIANGWNGPAYRFRDRKLERSWSQTCTAIREFCNALVSECHPLPGHTHLFTVKTDQDIQQGTRSERTIAAANELNAAATRLVVSWETTLELALSRLQLAARDDNQT